MQFPSQLLTVSLPSQQGQVTKYYTYDGYLEENIRARIRDQANSLQNLKWTGTAFSAYLGFIVKSR